MIKRLLAIGDQFVPIGTTSKKAESSPTNPVKPTKAEEPKSPTATAPTDPEPVSIDKQKLELYVDLFGAESGTKWCLEGRSVETCYRDRLRQLRDEHEAAVSGFENQIANLRCKLKVAEQSEAADISSGGADLGGKNSPPGFCLNRLRDGE